ncbi:MAG: beta-ketoacyl-[acyl-carrier-protein] synthase family protein [Parvularculaceae bacterium]
MSRVVVTGLGIICSLGDNVEQVGQALRDGRSGIQPLANIPTEILTIKVGAEVKGFEPGAHFQSSQIPLYDRTTQLALYAARAAIADAGLKPQEDFGNRSATILGTGTGSAHAIEECYHSLYVENRRRPHPFTVPRVMNNAPVSHISMDFGITGPSFMVSSACASANHAICLAYQLIKAGVADIVVTGGAEACITPGCMKGWEALRVMSPDTCRPFSKGRKGLVIGEGAGVFVFESLQHAKMRDANIHAEIAGVGMTSDAGNIVVPTLEGPVNAMRAALAEARVNPEDVGYINAHGTGTSTNDTTETNAIKGTFGDHARRLMVSSTKSMHGHALGGAGAIELLCSVLALRDGFIPPTMNFEEPDPECDLDYVPNEARDAKAYLALSNSFAFGGHNAVVALGRF